MKILVLGAAGLLGNAVMRVLSENARWEIFGTIRSEDVKRLFDAAVAKRLLLTRNLEDPSELVRLLDVVQPQVIVNCTALRNPASLDPMRSISLFSVLPQRLANLCRLRTIRLVQISSDGVFSGSRGQYTEDDLPDAIDTYGIAKLLGEVRDLQAITLRTSVIGHELQSANGLLEWFLSQENSCKCFTRAIFSGLPTVVLAEIIRDIVIPQSGLTGVYHVAAKPISKFDLLGLVSKEYKKAIVIVPDGSVVIDRSLNASRFQRATGYEPPSWTELVRVMRSFWLKWREADVQE